MAISSIALCAVSRAARAVMNERGRRRMKDIQETKIDLRQEARGLQFSLWN